jgi:tetratricopeptide (TPR) repeat protein
MVEAADGPPVAGDATPEDRRRMIAEALLTMMTAQTERRPMVLVAEDTHWMDPSTEEFLGLLVTRLRALPLMMLTTSRPDYDPPWTGHQHVTTLALNRLSRAACAAIVANMLDGRTLPDEILDQIVVKTDGVPLFVEELTKMVLESGLVEEKEGRYELTGPLPPLAIPASLHDSLMARLDHLGPVKEVAQLAAVLGPSFGEDLLAAVSGRDAADIGTAVGQLVDAELMVRHGMPPAASYEFKHALVREAAYGSLLISRRQGYHEQTAEALESRFGDTTEPEIIAHHYTEAGLPDRAVPYWCRAAEHASKRWAVAESVSHLERALELLKTVPDGSARAAGQVPMLLDLVAGYRILDRYEDALAALDEAEAVAVEHERLEDLSLVHGYRGNIYFPMGNMDGCLEQHQLAREYAHKAGSPEKEVRALSGLGDAYYMRGRLITAHGHYDECVRLCREHGLASIESANLPLRGHTLLYMDRPEEGLKDTMDAAALAAREGNERAEMIARGSCAGKILFHMGDLAGAREQCERGIDIARRIGARRFEPVNQVIIAKVMALEGDRPGAIALAEQAVAISRETGPKFAGPMALGTLALVTDDMDVRRTALSEGVSLLDEGCVSHNYLWFYRDVIEALTAAENWDGVEAFAQAAEDYTRDEPLPWMDRIIETGRSLAGAARGR